MVVKAICNQLLSLTCMVNTLLTKENKEETESCSGLILFSPTLQDLYIIAASAGPTSGSGITYESQTRNFYKFEIIFKVSKQLHKISTTKILQWTSPDFETELKMVFQPDYRWKLSYEKNESDEITLLSTFRLYRVKRESISPQVLNAMTKEAIPLYMDKIW